MALEINDKNISEILSSDQPVMVDFWAEWCGPCRMIAPIVDEISREFEGKAVVGKVNVDNNPDTAAQYGIRNIPTILFFKGGQVVDKVVGVVPKEQLVQKLQSL
ncbi:thioredoxin [Ornithobacterium rhinotracheale]|uniref:thioredoxin n=1 Tax=Ornithobacterium rhinotracheale TaxID=28251 RepID=UPI00129C6D37|nr:thioredoxin [Ornithobacterium rhinotracheale]MRI63351.1 thioredoxin [Ornithobacterium rhinotracheale]MRJ08909.1 thioredoxin [Ornithobacterium rhinotracheale]UOH78808.1 thioredoxin [Ornithobacterium rhinotracheale]